jgi:hypothetical protein
VTNPLPRSTVEAFDPFNPFGCFKQSGLRRDGLKTYLETQTIIPLVS